MNSDFMFPVINKLSLSIYINPPFILPKRNQPAKFRPDLGEIQVLSGSNLLSDKQLPDLIPKESHTQYQTCQRKPNGIPHHAFGMRASDFE